MFCSHPRSRVSASLATACGAVSLVLTLFFCGPSAAQDKKHVHGTVRMDVAIEGTKLTVQIEAPLDSLVGFEHRPRTDSQRKVAAEALRLMQTKAPVIADAAAQCTLVRTEVDAEVLGPAPAKGVAKGEHADLDATYEFDCVQIQKLRKLDIELFRSFSRIKRIEARVAGPKGQKARILTPANTSLPLE